MRGISIQNLRNLNIVRALKLERFRTSSIILVALGLVIILNLVAAPVGLRLDLSQNQAYSLSSSTRDILSQIEEPVTITFYVTDELPAQLKPLRTDVTDLLNEYDRASGKVIIETRDPKSNNEAATAAQEAGIPEIQFSQMEQDSFNVSTGYFGITIVQGEQSEVIPQATDLGSIEYNLSSAIYKLTQGGETTIAITGAQPAMNPMMGNQPQQGPDTVLRQLLADQFTLTNIDLSSSSATVTPVPVNPEETGVITEDQEMMATVEADIDTVVAFTGNGKQYDSQEINGFREYLNRGGKMIVLASGVDVNPQFQMAEVANHGLYPLLSDYGLKLNRDLVLSADSEMVNAGGSGGFNVITAYPLWVVTNQLNEESTLFGNITALLYPWSSSIELENREGYNVRPLVQSTVRSWRQTEDYTIDAQQVVENRPSEFGQYIVTAASENTKTTGEILLIASNLFAQYTSPQYGNYDLLLNAVNEFASDGALSGIRQRAVEFYPLPSMNQSEQNFFKYSTMLLMPVVFILAGAYHITRRRS
ncbi:MAG: GldG family protein [Patescibacteria group bacterium]